MLVNSVKKFNNLKLFQKYFFLKRLIIFWFVQIDFIFIYFHFELDFKRLFWKQICHIFLSFMHLLFGWLHFRLHRFQVPLPQKMRNLLDRYSWLLGFLPKAIIWFIVNPLSQCLTFKLFFWDLSILESEMWYYQEICLQLHLWLLFLLHQLLLGAHYIDFHLHFFTVFYCFEDCYYLCFHLLYLRFFSWCHLFFHLCKSLLPLPFCLKCLFAQLFCPKLHLCNLYYLNVQIYHRILS